MSNHNVLRGSRLKYIAGLLLTVGAVLVVSGCGGGNGTSTTPPSQAKNRAFISNTYSGSLQIVDTQNDTTPLTAQTTNSSGQIVPGTPQVVTVGGSSAGWEIESPNHATTAVYDPTTKILYFVTNSSESTAGEIGLTNPASMALFSTDSTLVYVPIPGDLVSGSRPGVLDVINVANDSVTATYAIPSARYEALSPSGEFLLVFADNTDSVYLLDLTATTVTPVAIPGFAGPVSAFFSSDSNTAYVINCGPECGSSGPASVSQLDIPSQTIKATVTVGGASVGYLNGTTLYVAGSPVPPGTTSTFDAVDISSMSRLTATSVAISDGYHTTMALNNNKLYIGANTCSNTTTGCLSVVNVSNNTADAPFPPNGAVTSIMSIPNRKVMYVIQGGYLDIYDTDTDSLQGTQLSFTGALYGIVQVDPFP